MRKEFVSSGWLWRGGFQPPVCGETIAEYFYLGSFTTVCYGAAISRSPSYFYYDLYVKISIRIIIRKKGVANPQLPFLWMSQNYYLITF